MSSSTVRIDDATRDKLRQLAERTGETMQAVLQRAIEEYRRQQFLDEVNAGYAALRKDARAWKQELAERRAWDVTLADGLDEP